MYLIKLEMPLNSRRAADALRDGQNMHRLLCRQFDSARQDSGLLYRTQVDRGTVRIYLYADSIPENRTEGVTLAGYRELGPWLEQMQEGAVRGFDLVAMPAKKVYRSERDRNSQRRVLKTREERMEWLERKAMQNGFAILTAEELEQTHTTGYHSREKGGAMHFDGYHYRGILQITDPELFRKALRAGIGSGKAYGLGMLLVRQL